MLSQWSKLRRSAYTNNLRGKKSTDEAGLTIHCFYSPRVRGPLEFAFVLSAFYEYITNSLVLNYHKINYY